VTAVGSALPEVVVQRATGEPVELGAFMERMLLVVAIRYYG